MKKYDVIIIGSGIAGITSAIYLKRNGKKVLIIEANTPGGQLNRSSIIENYPGYSNIDGPTLAINLFNQIKDLNVDYLYEEVIKTNLENKEVITENHKLVYNYLIIATGRSPKKLDILNKYLNSGVSYCALCDGALYKNKNVCVVGGGSSAFEEAYYLSKICQNVTILNRSNTIKAEVREIELVKSSKNINIVLNTEITKIDKKEEEFIINDKYQVSAIFVSIGYYPNSSIFDVEKLNDYIIVDNHCKTNKKDVYAIGDVINKEIYQLVSASNDGITAAIDIIKNQR